MSGEGVHIRTFLWLSCVSVCAGLACRGAGGAGGTCSRGVFEVGARPERVLRPHTCWCVQALLLCGTWATCCLCCAFCEQRNCCDPSWELVRASG